MKASERVSAPDVVGWINLRRRVAPGTIAILFGEAMPPAHEGQTIRRIKVMHRIPEALDDAERETASRLGALPPDPRIMEGSGNAFPSSERAASEQQRGARLKLSGILWRLNVDRDQ